MVGNQKYALTSNDFVLFLFSVCNEHMYVGTVIFLGHCIFQIKLWCFLKKLKRPGAIYKNNQYYSHIFIFKNFKYGSIIENLVFHLMK